MSSTNKANKDQPKNIVVLVVDLLSASMLGPYGTTLIDTPNFNRLAGSSLLFDFAYSNSTNLTSAYESFWQIPAQVKEDSGDRGSNSDQTEERVLFSTAVGELGLESTLISDSVSVCEHRLAEFDRIIKIEQPECSVAAINSADTQLANFFAQATLWLSEMQAGSVCWLHSMGLAGAWDAPYDFRLRLAGEEDPEPPTFVKSPSQWIDPETVDPDELLGLQQSACAQLQLLDEFLGVLLDVMDSDPIWDSTLFCLTSPRACAIGEHGLVGPGEQLFNESIQVPLLIRQPSKRTMRTGNLVQANLLSQVACDWLRYEQSEFEARLNERAEVMPSKETNCVLVTSSESEAVQTHAWKLIRSKMGGVQLFAKPDDRWEVNDVSSLCPDVVRKLVVLLDHLLENKSTGRSKQVTLPHELAYGLE